MTISHTIQAVMLVGVLSDTNRLFSLRNGQLFIAQLFIAQLFIALSSPRTM